MVGIAAREPLRPAPRAELGDVACSGAAVSAVPLALERVEGALVVANTVSDLAGVRGTRVRVLAIVPLRRGALAAHATCLARILAAISAVPPAPLPEHKHGIGSHKREGAFEAQSIDGLTHLGVVGAGVASAIIQPVRELHVARLV